ncbi:hypothetical protein LTR84_000925 [Exophiala bonariae]|uniref:Uncharacterized protein n=1 Tax=Exophiala bonariae TaxID=1690606 RepID=A0AAV9NTN8_9EURO|nr:hypothetical protein LTR84_000925 [Exophiala bonariae]
MPFNPGLGAVICEKFAAQGADIAVNYVSNKERAEEVAEQCRKEFGVRVVTLQADAGSADDIARLVEQSVEQLGGLDVVIHNAGWTRFATFGDLNDLSIDEWNKCWNVNVMSQLLLMQQVAPIFKNNSEGGVFIITSSVAGTTVGGSSMGYCVTKAAGLRLMKCLASTQGLKIRINAVLPGLLLTEWGMQFPETARKAGIEKAVLKQETKLDDCADAFVAIAMNTSMTGQQIVVDSGIVI